MSHSSGNNSTPETPVFAGPGGYASSKLEVRSSQSSLLSQEESDAKYSVTRKGYAPGTFVVDKYMGKSIEKTPVSRGISKQFDGIRDTRGEREQLRNEKKELEAKLEAEKARREILAKLPNYLLAYKQQSAESEKYRALDVSDATIKQLESREDNVTEVLEKLYGNPTEDTFNALLEALQDFEDTIHAANEEAAQLPPKKTEVEKTVEVQQETLNLSLEVEETLAEARSLKEGIDDNSLLGKFTDEISRIHTAFAALRRTPVENQLQQFKEQFENFKKDLETTKEYISKHPKVIPVHISSSPSPETAAVVESDNEEEKRKILEEAYSRENIRKVKKAIDIKPNSGQIVLLEKGGSIFSFEIGNFDKKEDLFTLKKIPDGDTIKMKYEKVKEYLARQEINRQLQTSTPSKKENQKEEKVLIPPLKDFSTAFNAAQGFPPNAAASWVKRWVDSGKIDEFRKAHGNIHIDGEVIDFAKKALPVYIEGLKLTGISKERKDSILQSIKIYAGILTGVNHEKLNNIENMVDRRFLPDGNLKELEEDLKNAHNPKKPAAASKVKTGNRLIHTTESVDIDETNKDQAIQVAGGGSMKLEDYAALRQAEEERKKTEKVEITDETLNRWYELFPTYKAGDTIEKKEMEKLTVFITYDRMFRKNQHAFLGLYSVPEFDKEANELRYVSNRRFHMGTEQEKEAIRKVFERHNLHFVDPNQEERREERRKEKEEENLRTSAYKETFRPLFTHKGSLKNGNTELKEERDVLKRVGDLGHIERMADPTIFADIEEYERLKTERQRLVIRHDSFYGDEAHLDAIIAELKKNTENDDLHREFYELFTRYKKEVTPFIAGRKEELALGMTLEERERNVEKKNEDKEKKTEALKKIDAILGKRIEKVTKEAELKRGAGNGTIRKIILASIIGSVGTYYALKDTDVAAEQAPQRIEQSAEQAKSWTEYIAHNEGKEIKAKEIYADIKSGMSLRDLIAKRVPTLVNKDKPGSIDNVLEMDGRKVLYSEGVYNMGEDQQRQLSDLLRAFQNLYEATKAPLEAEALANGTPYTYNPPNDFEPGYQTKVKDYMEKIIGEIKKADH